MLSHLTCSLTLQCRLYFWPHFIKTLRLRKLAIYLKRHVLNPLLCGAKAKALEIEEKGLFGFFFLNVN